MIFEVANTCSLPERLSDSAYSNPSHQLSQHCFDIQEPHCQYLVSTGGVRYACGDQCRCFAACLGARPVTIVLAVAVVEMAHIGETEARREIVAVGRLHNTFLETCSVYSQD